MRKFMKVSLLFLVLMFMPALDVQAEDVVSVRAQGKALLSDYTTPVEARAIAMNNARRVALTDAIEGKSAEPTQVYTSESVDALIGYLSRGFIQDESITDSGWAQSGDGRMFWNTVIEAKVKRVEGASTAPFNVEKAEVVPAGKKSAGANPVFHAGTSLQIKVIVDKSAYIHIFAVDRNGNVFTVYPNRYDGGNLALQSGKELVYPTDSLISRGIKLRAATTRGFTESMETVLVIATRKKTKFLKQIEHPTLSDLMAELSAIDRAEWTAKSVGYTVEGGH